MFPPSDIPLIIGGNHHDEIIEIILEAGVSFNVEKVAECTKTNSGKRNPIINLTRMQRFGTI